MLAFTPANHRKTSHRNNSGFTLIELMISLAIMAILLAAAVPAMMDFLERNQSRAIISEVRNLVALARENAVHHGCHTIMCPSDDRVQCSRNMDAPVMVFSDCNRNREIDGDDELYRVMQPLPENSQLHWSFSAGRRYIQMTPQGHTNSTFGSLIYCPASGKEEHARLLIISRSGRARYGKDTNGDGIPNRASGENVGC
ncbi:GspH/FimT family pseudopilin [Porticoccus sp. W117]|uniref:GspH/FimT family pseudopilin n=1 Tax=Porticoccus sp. W117 TaxID=3054777 RepID=UPI0025949CCB|nr:GspH/FimT family pseudopilin [Porticoccus sp. W117]MDM3871255.1 GspH/FimT family pseudopilin [Porticoccus sp. W117]